ncbi:hypothetical protein R1flu_000882 [Riccia fluitans]|uniref:Uncharacterized protein n=1 Tax=Riccia fluitans TaxID=41844 RepID=A0ABD1Y4N0_9MARC
MCESEQSLSGILANRRSQLGRRSVGKSYRKHCSVSAYYDRCSSVEPTLNLEEIQKVTFCNCAGSEHRS